MNLARTRRWNIVDIRRSLGRGLAGLTLAAVAFGLCGAAPAPKSGAAQKIPEPENVGGRDLTTRDGVQLDATFYPSAKGKEAVPVILLHSWKGDRREYDGLAPLLQKQGQAVLVPDLRGHGKSTTGPNPDRPLKAEHLGPDDFARMVTYDMETLKAFLMRKNNAGELNIEKLCVVGGEMGASVALKWAEQDWSWPPLVGKKQGQDVHALVLISPQLNFHGLSVTKTLTNPNVRSELAMLIIVGRGDVRAQRDAKRIAGMIERFHPAPSDPQEQDFFLYDPDTKLQGTKMLGVQGLNLETGIANFINQRLVQSPASWAARD